MTTIPLTPDTISAKELFQSLRALRERLPDPQALDPGKASSRLAHVDPKFVNASVDAVRASEPVQKALGRSPDQIREKIDDTIDLDSVTVELLAMLKAVNAVKTVRKREIGLAALQTYKICQQLARDPANATLVSHIEEMKRLNRFGRKRSRRAQPVPEPQPQPQPQPQPAVTTKAVTTQ